jgi:hypothetical protein
VTTWELGLCEQTLNRSGSSENALPAEPDDVAIIPIGEEYSCCSHRSHHYSTSVPTLYRNRTGAPPRSRLFCAASMKANISSVSSFSTGAGPPSKKRTIRSTSGR